MNEVSNIILWVKITGKQLAILLFALESWKCVQLARALSLVDKPPMMNFRPPALSRNPRMEVSGGC